MHCTWCAKFVNKNNPLEKICISAMVATAWVLAKLSHFVCEYSHSISLRQPIRFNRYSSLNLRVHLSSEHAKFLHWIFTNNKSNFAQLFISSTNVSNFQWWMSAVYSPPSISTVFRMSTSCSNTRWKSVAKSYDCCKWTLTENNYALHRPQSLSARQCWSAVVCISGSIPALHPFNWHYASGAFAVSFFTPESEFNYLFS